MQNSPFVCAPLADQPHSAKFPGRSDNLLAICPIFSLFSRRKKSPGTLPGKMVIFGKFSASLREVFMKSPGKAGFFLEIYRYISIKKGGN